MDMAAVASPATQLVLKISTPNSHTRFQNATRIAFGFGDPTTPILSTKSFKNRACVVRAADPDREERNSYQSGPDDSALLSQEDLNYLVKLGAGSVAGSAAIKYGSVVFPEITRPNIIEALSIVSFPVIAAVVVLLIRQSRSE